MNLDRTFIAHKREAKGGDPEAIQSLASHLLEVGDLSAGFAEKIGLPAIGRLIGLLHDFGKYSEQFQNYIASAVGDLDVDDADYVDAASLKGKVDHSSAGAQYIWKEFSRYGKNEQGRLVGQILALCIASHHSGLIDCFDKDNNSKFIRRMDKPDDFTHLEECKSNADDIITKRIREIATGEICTSAFKKILEVAYIKPGGSDFSKAGWFNIGFFTRFLFSALIDADRLNSAEFETPFRKKERLARQQYFNWDVAIERVEEFVEGLQPRHRIDELRQSISKNCLNRSKDKQGIYTLTVPTGGGKTFSSLRYAIHHAKKHKLDRIIYIIPYTSIIEQNAGEIRRVVEKDGDEFSWVLEQHSNLEPEKQSWRNKLVSENWDSPIVLTTMVQFLEVCFAGGTRSVRRLHQLARSVIIFDEIQTLPINCIHLFCSALGVLVNHCNTTAVLCTATQPLLNKLKNGEKGRLNISPENEIVDDVNELFVGLDRVDVINRIQPAGWQAQDVADLAVEQFNSAGSCLVIVNTKNWARDLYNFCSRAVPAESLFHLSTNQCPAHRKHLLDQMRARLAKKLPVLCISTQLIEAGVDVSFACVIRFLAGLDSIAQAAGRCNRHGESVDENGNPAKGKVFVVNPDIETTDLLKDIEAGKEASRRVLSEGFDNLVSPEAISQYFKYYFFDRASDMEYRLDINKIGRSDTLLNLLSDNSECPARFSDRPADAVPLLRQSFMEAGKQFRAIDAPTQAVVVPYGEDGEKIINELCAVDKDFNAGRYYEALKAAQKFSVNVFPNVWDKLKESEAVYEVQPDFGVYHLDKRHYDDRFGLSETPVGMMEVYDL